MFCDESCINHIGYQSWLQEHGDNNLTHPYFPCQAKWLLIGLYDDSCTITASITTFTGTVTSQLAINNLL